MKMRTPIVKLFAIFGIACSWGARGDAQTATTLISFTVNQGLGFGYGTPGQQSSNGKGALLLTLNGNQTLVNLDHILIDGNGTTTEIRFFTKDVLDILHFEDTSANYTTIETIRSGTAKLLFGTGAFHGASGSLSYSFNCHRGCFLGGGVPEAGPFDFVLTGSGQLSLNTATAQAILPSLFPTPPPSPGIFQTWINNQVTRMGGPPASTDDRARAQVGLAEDTSAVGTSAFTLTPPEQFVLTTYRATVTCANSLVPCWLSIPTPTGNIAPFTNTPIAIDSDTTNFSPGVYPASITLALTPSPGAGSPVSQKVGATLIVTNGSPNVQLSETALRFTAAAGVNQPPFTHAVALSSSNAAPTPFTTAVSTTAGGNWLSVTPGSAIVSSASPTLLNVKADPSGLAAGSYFGRVDITAPNALIPFQSVVVQMSVLAAGASVPAFAPAGLIFVKQSANPLAQVLNVTTLSPQPVSIKAGPLVDESSPWLSVSSSGAAVAALQPLTQTVSIFSAGLAAGVHTGSISEFLANGTSAAIPVALIVTPSTACTPTQQVAVFTSLVTGFEVLAGSPVSIGAQVFDDCGTPLTAGSVVAFFSTGDPPTVLAPLSNGQWSGTWTPHGNSGPVAISLNARDLAGLTGAAAVNGIVDPNATAPVVASGAIVNAASLLASDPTSPGEFISIFGSNLATATTSAASSPGPTQLSGTQVLLGGRPLSLSYVSSNQINAVIPNDVATNAFEQLLVLQNGVYALPETVVIAAANPAIFTQDGSGTGAGAVQLVKPDGTLFLNTPSTPASPGDALVIYCTGLGAADAAGTVDGVNVIIGGQSVQPFFAGRTPGYVGLYQVNVILPAGITPGASVPLALTAQGFSSRQGVTVSIQ